MREGVGGGAGLFKFREAVAVDEDTVVDMGCIDGALGGGTEGNVTDGVKGSLVMSGKEEA